MHNKARAAKRLPNQHASCQIPQQEAGNTSRIQEALPLKTTLSAPSAPVATGNAVSAHLNALVLALWLSRAITASTAKLPGPL